LQVLADHRSLQATTDRVREQLDEEQESRSELQRQLTRANNEAAAWRSKFESGEGGIRPEEMDELKKKLTARIQVIVVIYYAARHRGHFRTARSVRLSVPWSSCLPSLEAR